MNTRPRVLVLTPWFLPGEQGGGSVLAVRYLVEQLAPAFEFVVATGDRDFGATEPYAESARREACEALQAPIHYLPPGPARAAALWQLLKQPFDLIYLNSVLSPGLTLLPLLLRRAGLARQARLLIAPRGELQQQLLAMKSGRKRLYLQLMKAAGLFQGAWLQATSDAEAQDLQALELAPVMQAADLAPTRWPALPAPRPVAQGPLRVAFVSRIDRNKNLAQVLRVLARLPVPVAFSVAGPVGDADYWSACEAQMRDLPAHITVRKCGALAHDAVLTLLAEQELLFLPTWSENHGYVIHEALLAGCALLISDRTPWRGLAERGVGWDLPLDNDQALADALTTMAGLTPAERLSMRQRAQAWGRARLDGAGERAAMQELLRRRLAEP